MIEPESPHEHTVLIIEDQPHVAYAMARVLNPKFNVRIVPDTEKGFIEVTNVRIDLVLLDVCLPGRSALEFCEVVKSDADLKYLPIIMVSGLRPLEDKVRGVEFGTGDYLSKPFFVEELRARVLAAIRRSQKLEKESHQAQPSPPDTVHFAFEPDNDSPNFEININLN